ncbi:hook family protein [Cavenderia fasciculata]|uniref:Hook family protein n=1 Tax=Cavenderia fasciculata TaxID=261658 RepID=F4Q6U0_CACFS|nr:hook family protein [Cavenderia fasciculata]EGG16600.1 hook family protein [Cavenderia fasciculata]|eukprot:XP_004355000.1 hook family protein [Cavenderia fasciculata]
MIDQSLVKWINTFEGLSNSCDSLSDLSDGVILYEIANQISSKYFDSPISSQDNWVLKSDNIKTLLAALDAYYNNELTLTNQVDHIDADQVAKNDEEEIVNLIKVILGIAVECDDKEKYIGAIMNLDADVQNDMMVIIGEIMASHQSQMGIADNRTSFDDSNNHSDIETKSTNKEEILLTDERVTMFQHQIEQLEKEKVRNKDEIEEMSIGLTQLEAEKKSLLLEKENLVELCTNLQQTLVESQKLLADHKAQASMNVMTDHRIKEEIHNLQLQIEDKDKYIYDLKKKIEEGIRQINENRELRDEIDILREKAITAEATEEKLKKFQHKIEEINELKKQIRTLEDNNDNYLQQILDLEEQLKKSVSYKSQMEQTKQQILSLKIENTKMELSIKSITEERDKLASTVSQYELDQQSLTSQLEGQRKKLQDLEHDKDSKLLEESSSGGGGGGFDQIMDSSTKERLFRLERENKRLKESIEKVPELENQLEEANTIKEDLLNQIVILKATQSSSSPSTTTSTTVTVVDNKEHLVEIEKLKQQLADLTTQLGLKNQSLEDSANQNDELKKQLVEVFAKSNTSSNVNAQELINQVNELTTEKERLEGYLRAARKMIKDLREKNKDNQSKDIQITEKEDHISKLEATIKQKDDRIDQLVRQLREGKESSQRELNLMLTSFMNIGLELEKMKNGQSLTEPRAFLNKKRND